MTLTTRGPMFLFAICSLVTFTHAGASTGECSVRKTVQSEAVIAVKNFSITQGHLRQNCSYFDSTKTLKLSVNEMDAGGIDFQLFEGPLKLIDTNTGTQLIEGQRYWVTSAAKLSTGDTVQVTCRIDFDGKIDWNTQCPKKGAP